MRRPSLSLLRARAAGLQFAGLALFGTLLAGCSAGDLIPTNQCTPQTCDYVVNQLAAVSDGSTVTLIADSNNAIYRYDGSKWNKVGDELATQREAMVVSPAFTSDSTLFLGNTVSNNGGQTWSPLCAQVIGISPNYGSDKTVFARDAVVGGTPTFPGNGTGTPIPVTGCPTSSGSFYASKDGGKTWNAVSGPKGAGNPDKFVVSPTFATDSTIVATFTANLVPALYASTDGGQTWKKILDNRQDVVAVSTGFATDKTLAVANGTDGVQISTDAGQTWTKVKTPVDGAHIKQISFSPNYSSDKTIVLVSAPVDTGSSEQHGVFTSTDSGKTWNQASTLTQRGQNYPAVLFSPLYATDKTVYTASLDQDKGPAKSSDLGQNWTAFPNGLPEIQGLGG